MSNTLAERIDAEFTAVAEKLKQFQTHQIEEYQERQKRLEQLGKLFDELRDIWKPRLELLTQKFGDRVKVSPRIVPSTREAAFEFKSSLANVSLKFAASTDREVRKVILTYDLEIIPVLLNFTPHKSLEFPLDAVDKTAVGQWLDDRVIDFVQTYLSLGDNEYYLKDQMVEDPIAKVRFPKMAAGATLEWKNQQFYFISTETRREFEKQQGIKAT